MANGFGAPPSPYPDMGGGDLPQPGTPQWAALMAMLSGQAPMAGQIPGQPITATATPTAGGGNVPPPGPLAASADASQRPGAFANASSAAYPDEIGPERGMSSATAAGIPTSGITPMPASRVVKGVGPAAIAASPPPVNPPVAAAKVKQQPNPAKHAPPQPAYNPLAGGSANTGLPYGQGAPPQPAYNPLAGGSANTGQPYVTPVDDPAMLYPHRMISGVPGAPSNGAVPNLGYYRPTSGIAQGPGTWTQYGPNDPRMFRGPLASQPTAPAAAAPPAPAPAAPAAAPGPGPIAPGVGTLWLRKLFGGGAQPTA